jgi:hypothetical protein
LQTQAAELRAALHSSVDQNKVCITYTMTLSTSIQESFLNLSVTKKFIGSYQTFEKMRGIYFGVISCNCLKLMEHVKVIYIFSNTYELHYVLNYMRLKAKENSLMCRK